MTVAKSLGAPALLSPAFGALMIAAAARPASHWGLVALALAACAVVAGVFVRGVAAAAVLLTVVAIGFDAPSPLFAAVSGLSAAAYLATRHAGQAVTLTAPTVAGMLGFAVAGVLFTTIPLRLSWAPLLAPVIIAAILIAVVSQLAAGSVSGPGADREPPDRYE